MVSALPVIRNGDRCREHHQRNGGGDDSYDDPHEPLLR
jgi:hypothetical protein